MTEARVYGIAPIRAGTLAGPAASGETASSPLLGRGGIRPGGVGRRLGTAPAQRTEVPQEDFEGIFHTAMKNVHVPALVVRGSLSDVVTEEGVQEFRGQIPHAKVVGGGGASHKVADHQNDAFSDSVIGFLEHAVRPRLGERR